MKGLNHPRQLHLWQVRYDTATEENDRPTERRAFTEQLSFVATLTGSTREVYERLEASLPAGHRIVQVRDCMDMGKTINALPIEEEE